MPSEHETEVTKDTSWYYESNKTRKGPVTEVELAELFKNDAINAQTLVWKNGYNDWKPLSDTELKIALKVDELPPPLTGKKVNNIFFWLLVFAPLWGTLVELSVFKESHIFYWFILNSILAVADETQLKKAGHDSNNLFWAIILVPVFVWKRITITKISRAPFWIYIACIIFAAAINTGYSGPGNTMGENQYIVIPEEEQYAPASENVKNLYQLGQEVYTGKIKVKAIEIKDPYNISDDLGMLSPGNKYVGVEIAYRNISKTQVDYNVFLELQLVDSEGQVFEPDIFAGNESIPRLVDGIIPSGETRKGIVIFQTPKSSGDFTLQYIVEDESYNRLAYRIQL